MTKTIQGKLADHPLAELIREIGEGSASGALRLSRERAKTVVYFEKGAVVFAASNIRAHRLAEFLKRAGIIDAASLRGLPATATDDEILSHLARADRNQALSAGTLRANQVADILRATLLWTQGDWEFDPRVRVTGDTRVTIDVERLLVEASRHLPSAYVSSRLGDAKEQIEPVRLNGQPANLLPVEAFVLSRVTSATSLDDLLAATGLTGEQTLRAVYSLAICGAVKRSAWATSEFNPNARVKAGTTNTRRETGQAEKLEDFLARIERGSNHYQILGVGRQATPDEIKSAYHSLARRFHPDRFHQASARIRGQIESAFARVAQAHEVLSDTSSRADYDAQFATSESLPAGSRPSGQTPPASPNATTVNPAETSFQKGVAAMKQNQPQSAVRFFAQAASLAPRCARYRGEYGRALIADPGTRRLAEIELKAAIALEPEKVSYRVVLAELYKVLGLRRRAEGELQRALVADPKNEAARNLLASLKN